MTRNVTWRLPDPPKAYREVVRVLMRCGMEWLWLDLDVNTNNFGLTAPAETPKLSPEFVLVGEK